MSGTEAEKAALRADGWRFSGDPTAPSGPAEQQGAWVAENAVESAADIATRLKAAVCQNGQLAADSVLEAMASALPCLAVDCPTGPSDLIDPGLNGWLVSEQVASTDMEQPLRQALEDVSARAAFASRAQAVRQRNAPESLRPLFLDLMGSL